MTKSLYVLVLVSCATLSLPVWSAEQPPKEHGSRAKEAQVTPGGGRPVGVAKYSIVRGPAVSDQPPVAPVDQAPGSTPAGSAPPNKAP